MSLDILAQGKLIRPPEQRTASTGRPYALATVAISQDEGEVVASVFAFRSEPMAALLALDKGDACAVAGRAKVSIYQPREGDPRPSLSITADAVLSVYAIRKKRAVAQGDDEAEDGRAPTPAPDRPVAPRQASRSSQSAQGRLPVTTDGVAEMRDDIPF